MGSVAIAGLVLASAFAYPCAAAGVSDEFTQPAVIAYMQKLDAALQAKRRSELRSLLSRFDDRALLVSETPAANLVAQLYLSRAQRLADSPVDMGSARYLAAAIQMAQATALLRKYHDAVLVEGMLMAWKLRSDASDTVRAMAIVDPVARLDASSLIIAASVYGEDPDNVFRIASTGVKSGNPALALTLNSSRITYAESRYGKASQQAAGAHFQRAMLLPRADAPAEMAEIRLGVEALREVNAAGNHDNVEDRVSYPTEFARRAARAGNPAMARSALDLAASEVAVIASLGLDDERRADMAREWQRLARLFLDTGYRQEGLDSFEKLFSYLGDKSDTLAEAAQAASEIATERLVRGEADQARPWLNQLERLVRLTGNEVPVARLRQARERIQRLLDVIAMSSPQNAGPSFKDDWLFENAMQPQWGGQGFDKWMEVLNASPISEQKAALPKVLASSVSGRPQVSQAQRGAMLTVLATVQRESGDDVAARQSIAMIEAMPAASPSFRRDVQAPAVFMKAQLLHAAGRHAEAQASLLWSYQQWAGAGPNYDALRISTLHWRGIAQLDEKQYDKLDATVDELRRLVVRPDLANSQAAAISSLQAYGHIARGRRADALVVLNRALRAYVGADNIFNSLGLSAVIKAQSSVARSSDMAAVYALMHQLLETMDQDCGTDLSFMMSLMQAHNFAVNQIQSADFRFGSKPLMRRLSELDRQQWGIEIMVDVAVRAFEKGDIAVARAAYREVVSMQTRSVAVLPMGGGNPATMNSTSLERTRFDRISRLRTERMLLGARTAKEAAQILETSLPPSYAGLIVNLPTQTPWIDIPVISDGPYVEYITYRPSSDTAACTGMVGQARVASFVVQDNHLVHVSRGSLSSEVRASEVALRKDILAKQLQPGPGELTKLHDKLLRVPLEVLGMQRLLNIRPDPATASLPFNLILAAHSDAAMHGMAVRILPPTQLLVGLSASKPSKERPTAIGNPDYGPPRPGNQLFNPLYWSKSEAEQVEEKLKVPTQLLQGKSASPAALLLLEKPSVLHIATHVFADERTLVAQDGEFGSAARMGLAMTSVRIALANANSNELGMFTTGVITSLTLSALDLQGTQLVVFSGCDSAMSGGNVGYMTTGLTLSAHIAGAKSVVSTLWPVDDGAGPIFMGMFYALLHQGQSPADALRNAQAQMRAQSEFKAPYYWAPYVVSGVNAPLEGVGAADADIRKAP